LLRAFGGDGWGDLGLRPNLRLAWRWYLLSALLLPLIVLATLAIGLLAGAISPAALGSIDISTVLALSGAAFGAAMVKNIFEEFAWRGYLTPRFAELGLSRMSNHLLTGLIWGAWHIPYWIFFLNRTELQRQTPLELGLFVPLAWAMLIVQAITYGELRLRSGSTWPAWLLHTVDNALSVALPASQLIEQEHLQVLFAPGAPGIVSTGLFVLVGLWLYRGGSTTNREPRTENKAVRSTVGSRSSR
jgi:membrane protease YdiL (CAAX protease family)